MRLTEKREYAHVIGKQCDYCGKTLVINSLHDMIEIKWYSPGSQGCCDATGLLDVCSTECFIKILPRLNDWQAYITQINNTRYFETLKGV